MKFINYIKIKSKQAFRYVLIECKDKTTIIIFITIFLIMGSPTWLGYTLYFFTNNEWHLTYATGWLILWNVVPCTPYIGICLAITLGIKKIIKRIKRK